MYKDVKLEMKKKLSFFADDITCIIKNKLSYTKLFRILESFGECSGLKVNNEKTEMIPPGDNRMHENDLPKHIVCGVIKILGI